MGNMHMNKEILTGPFRQILTMSGLNTSGPLLDENLEIIENGGILIENQRIKKVLSSDEFNLLRKKMSPAYYMPIEGDAVLTPGFIDTHTHICYAGSRAMDYARRLAGETYLEIAKKGGGILSSVEKTREAEPSYLEALLTERTKDHLKRGVTTCEVKSGYGLSLESETKMLRTINAVSQRALSPEPNHTTGLLPDIIPTCLAAHYKPKEFESHKLYLDHVADIILPFIKQENLSQRADIFIEEGAFSPEMALSFLKKAVQMGFSITVHADQFNRGGSKVAAEVGAISADHLEASTDEDFKFLKSKGVIATVLPGATLGLGLPFAPARKMLDHGLSVVIASDWNPGSAPMGDLLTQASFMGAAEKLTLTETLAAITTRAARALELNDRGEIRKGSLADMLIFQVKDYREIFYNQGTIKPFRIIKRGLFS